MISWTYWNINDIWKFDTSNKRIINIETVNDNTVRIWYTN